MATIDSIFGGLMSALSPRGFERLGRRQLAIRPSAGVLQWVYLSTQQGCFSVDFAAQPLWVPKELLVMQPGGSIGSTSSPFGKRIGSARVDQSGYLRGEPSIAGASLENGYLWPFDDRVVGRITKALKASVLPWLDDARDAAGLLTVLDREQWASHHHHAFARATALAALDRLDDARSALDAAISGYQQDHATRGAAWCLERIERCRELAAAIAAGTHRELLARWAADTLACVAHR